MPTNVAQTFLQGLQIGGEIADRQTRNADRKRRIEQEDAELAWKTQASEALANILDEAAPGGVGAAGAPVAGDSGPGLVSPGAIPDPPQAAPAAPPPAAALNVPGNATQPQAALPAPNPAAVAGSIPSAAPQAPQSAATPPNFYRRLQDETVKLLRAGMPADQVLELKRAASAELVARGKPHAARAIQLLLGAEKLAAQGNENDAKGMQALAAKQLEIAYRYLPDNGVARIGVGPQGSLVMKTFDADGQPSDGPPAVVTASVVEDAMNQLFTPDAAMAMAANAAAREERRKKEEREDEKLGLEKRKVDLKGEEVGIKRSDAASQAAYRTAQAETARITAEAAATTAGARKTTAEKLENKGANSKAGAGTPFTRALAVSFGTKSKPASPEVVADAAMEFRRRLVNKQPIFDRRDEKGAVYFQGKKMEGLVVEQLAKMAARTKGALLVPPDQDDYAPIQ